MNWNFSGGLGLVDTILALFVVANVLPILPIVLGVVGSLPPAKRRRTTVSALLVGNCVALLFALGGGALLASMQSGLDDIRVAGGLILLIFAVFDLLFSREQRKKPLGEMAEEESAPGDGEVGLVPLGIPLMVGPATLTVTLVLAEARGIPTFAIALLVNVAINVGILIVGDRLLGFVGRGAVRASGKIFGLLLATLAVAMIRTGVHNMIQAG